MAHVAENQRTVLSALAELFEKAGAKRCFGVLGTANFVITHELNRIGVPFVASRHESAAASMADAYARLSGEFVLVSVHSGPGLTNAITGIAEAAKAGSAILVLAGDVAQGDLRSNFHFEQSDLVSSIGAVFERLHSVQTAIEDAERAVRKVVEERRTVVLSMPVDIQQAVLPELSLKKRSEKSYRSVAASDDAISKLTELVSASKRPLILAGRGAVVAGAKDALIALGDEIGALLATTVAANGIFASQQWSVGISGGFSSHAACDLIPQSDLIIGFGASFTKWTMREGSLIGDKAKIVQIDCNSSRMGFSRSFDLEIVADARFAAEALLSEIRRGKDGESKPRGWRTDATADVLNSGSAVAMLFSDTSGKGQIDPRTLTKAVDAILPMERVVVCDSGHFMGWPPQYFRVPDEFGWCQPTSFQSVGLGLASAIGASFAQPDRLIVLAIGDGGLMMSLGELETAVRVGARMCILIYNDLAYGAEVHYFSRRGYDIDIVRFPEISFSALAKSLGASSIKVEAAEDLAPLSKWVSDGANGIFIIDARITRDLEADWHNHAFRVTN